MKKERIKKAYMSEVVELDDFKEELNVINEKLDTLSKQLEENNLKGQNTYTPEKVMAKRDIGRIFLNMNYDDSFFLNQWEAKTKEEKQEFIAKYIESLTFKKNKNHRNGIELVDIKIKSLYMEKVNRLSELGLSQVPVAFETNGKTIILNVSYPLKESQVKEYLDTMKKTKAINFHMHPTFNYSLKDMPQEITFDLDKDEQPFKLIPVIKDIDSPDNVSNKFRLGIVTTNVKTVEMDSKEIP